MGGTVIAVLGLTAPFVDLPVWAQTLFYVSFVTILGVLAWTAVLFGFSREGVRGKKDPDPDAADRFLWVFLVPALNEAETIADSVGRLLQVEADNKVVVVIDDGSEDGTPDVLAGIASPELVVLRRDLPDARQGKARALNAGWRRLDSLLASGRLAGWPKDRVIVCIVDADGRLDPRAPHVVAPRFADDRVGGLQTLVRIYNRGRVLTWFQDVEFSVFGFLYQAGRTPYGAAGMGGNGQFNRLSALDSVVDETADGPWHDTLTEDQDLGLRLLAAGWRNEASAETSVDQQGPVGLRRLLRQRTRWAQGNFQAMRHLRRMARLDRPWLVRLDQIAYLLTPAIQALIGVAFAASIVLWISDAADFWGEGGWWQLAFFYLLGVGGVLLGCIARGARHGVRGVLGGVLLAPVYAAYAWLLWPVLARAAVRQAIGRRDWAKTAREPIRSPP